MDCFSASSSSAAGYKSAPMRFTLFPKLLGVRRHSLADYVGARGPSLDVFSELTQAVEGRFKTNTMLN